MINIIVVFPKIEDAKGIRALLIKNGFSVTMVCTTGAQVLNQIDGLNDGIVICCYMMADMIYSELHDCLPPGFEMLLLASQNVMGDCCRGDIVKLSMPLKVHDLIGTVEMMSAAVTRRRRKAKQKPKERNEEEVALIREAKELLMTRNNMSEEDAHHYIQKCSMDSCTNMVETAQMVLAMMRGA